MYLLPHLYGTAYHIPSLRIDTAETDEFIDITSAASCDFSDKFGEFAETLINENNMEIADDASSAFDLYPYLLSEIEEYSQTLNVLNFASVTFCNFRKFLFLVEKVLNLTSYLFTSFFVVIFNLLVLLPK